MAVGININERSWGIDIISNINGFVANKDLVIKAAGGENTLRGSANSLFPDVLLFSDGNKSGILQGWELKMPDTSVDDEDFISNARKKAVLLSLDSFLLWNVSTAVLYTRQGEEYTPSRSWSIPNGVIRNRRDVVTHKNEWQQLLETIILDLSGLFANGTLVQKQLIENLSFSSIIEVVLENTTATAELIRRNEGRNGNLRAEIDLWWRAAKFEYNDGDDRHLTLAKVVLTNWVIKFLFANILKRYFQNAQIVEGINFGTTVNDGINTFRGISESCDFWNIFSPQLGQECITPQAWGHLIQVNSLFRDVNIASIDVTLLQNLLQASILKTSRRIAGQFATPKVLAELLVRLTVDDVSGIVIDPCCGTGTIINEAYKLKAQYQLPEDTILNTTWASDKYAFPLQLATLTLTRPTNFGKIIKIFRADVVNLRTGENIDFADPTNGARVQIPFPTFDYVVSNLPFVQQEDLKILNPDIAAINTWIVEQTGERKVVLQGKSDLYAYLPFYLYQLIRENGKIGIIVSNAWLGTDYGSTFVNLLRKFFAIESVIVSGKGRWFENADVVTTILILRKKENRVFEGSTKFCVIKRSIAGIDDVNILTSPIVVNRSDNNVTIQEYSADEIAQWENFGLQWSALFTNLNWINGILDNLAPLTDFFSVGRGERRGWNAMFYPGPNNGIEADYIKPVLKNLRNSHSLTAEPNAIAFSCSRTIEELQALGHRGAINWIRRFEVLNNTDGEPLPQALERANHFWYEMKANTLADFAVNVNFDRSLFIARLAERSFADQRVIPFIQNQEFDENTLQLFHALFNCSLSMFFLEALGFGRGLGALDLNATKVRKNFKLLNPDLIDEAARARIIDAFQPLLNRNRLPLEEELLNADRLNFERILYTEFGIENYYDDVIAALLQLYRIRFAVNN